MIEHETVEAPDEALTTTEWTGCDPVSGQEGGEASTSAAMVDADPELAPNGKPFYEPFEDDVTIASEASTDDKGEAYRKGHEDVAATVSDGAGLKHIVAALVDLGAQVRSCQGPDFGRRVKRELDGLNAWQKMYVGGFLHLAGRAALSGFTNG